jgi:hypothetical protein
MQQQSEKYCIVPRETVIALLRDSDKLNTLEYHGVDNWENYNEALWDDNDTIYDDGESFKKKENSDYFEKLIDKSYKQIEL